MVLKAALVLKKIKLAGALTEHYLDISRRQELILAVTEAIVRGIQLRWESDILYLCMKDSKPYPAWLYIPK